MITRLASLPDDFAAIDELLRLCEAADALDMNVHRQALQAADGHNKALFQLWLDDDNHVQGFARLNFTVAEDEVEGRYWFYVRPMARGQEFEMAALHWAEQETRQYSGARVSRLFSSARSDHEFRFNFLESNGFVRERYFFTMKQPLDTALPAPKIPAGYTLRRATLAESEENNALQNLAFREHWNSQPESLEEFRAYREEPGYRADLDLVAQAADGSLVGFCVATLMPTKEDGTIGLIETLGTHPERRGLGLGRALLLQNLHNLQQMEITQAYISVDAANPTGALHLYESAGFKTFETWLSYFKKL
ncbi:putative acetyltransferase, GNAT [Dictyobacter alpinus]|uniref:Putative acetyltransferase, GNAT n=1 Tax=Dictyobacter alpinus TaxID=2014873 RepID=A0A402BC96_9CHLR|nr:GNAT family N-acetyltransferase [Dictyobacter alpinus]GCE28946.1 putative acetyltransferase, GNAT [Dictyobacter alpinus]